MSGVSVDDQCVDKYNQIKMKKDLRYVLFDLADKKKINFSEEGDKGKTVEDFRTALPDNEPRFALLDFDYETDDGRRKNWLGGRVRIEHARDSRNGDRFGGRGRSPPRRRGNPPGRRTGYRLIVENLSSRTSWQDLKDYMRQAGEITYT